MEHNFDVADLKSAEYYAREYRAASQEAVSVGDYVKAEEFERLADEAAQDAKLIKGYLLSALFFVNAARVH